MSYEVVILQQPFHGASLGVRSGHRIGPWLTLPGEEVGHELRGPIRYCTRCLSPSTRPNSRFDADGVCPPCRFAEESRDVDGESRLHELERLVAALTRGRRSSRWQCLVGVSGGKDSTRQALWVRERLGLNPLLVSVAYPPRQQSTTGAENLSNLIGLGFDTVVLGPAPRLSRELVREAFLRFLNWFKATEMALFAGVPRTALERRIPLIFWGENPALQVGDSGQMGETIWDGNRLVEGNTLAGGDLGWFLEVARGLDRLNMYRFPTSEEIAAARVQTVFLGPAWTDWSGTANSRFALAHGFGPRNSGARVADDPVGTSMVDEDFSTVNFLLKYFKLGFGRGTEHANELIRSGAISRDQGIEIAERFDGRCSDGYVEDFCRYIRLPVQEFWATVRRFAHPGLFDLTGERPRARFRPGVGVVA